MMETEFCMKGVGNMSRYLVIVFDGTTMFFHRHNELHLARKDVDNCRRDGLSVQLYQLLDGCYWFVDE